MSTETVAPQTGDQVQDRSAGGSHDLREDTNKAAEQGGADQGVSPGSEEAGEDSSAEITRVRQELQQLRERNENLEELRNFIDRNPDLREVVVKRINGQSAEPQNERGWAKVDKFLSTAFADSEQTRALSGLLKVAFEESVNEAVSRLEPEVRGVKAVVRGTQFEKSLQRQGVSSDIQESKAFNELIREQRSKRSFRHLEQNDPDYAAEILADSWRARTGTRESLAAERRRVEVAKNGGLTRSAPRGSASASETTKVRKGDLIGLRNLFAKGLTRDQIEIVE